jgi:hypothetical protein
MEFVRFHGLETGVCCALLIFGAIHVTPAQFVNLGFEDARTNSVTPSLNPGYPGEGRGAVSDLLPGWRLLQNGQPLTTMDYNNLGRTFEVRDYQSVIGPPGFGIPSEGQFAFFLSDSAAPDNYALVQRGDIPIDARLLFFQFRAGPFIASVNGEDISPTGFPYAETPRTVFADVSRFAGQTVELSFRPGGGTLAFSTSYLDNIGFAVPEPTPILILLVSAIVFATHRRPLP